jgi:hypothetical protein
MKLKITVTTEIEVEEACYPEDYNLEAILEEETETFSNDVGILTDILDVNDYTVTVEEA